MFKVNFVILGVVLWLMIGWVSLPYSIGVEEFTCKGLSYITLGGIFGDCLYHIVKGIIKEFKG